MDVAGLVIASGGALMKTYSALQDHREARQELPAILSESKRRVQRMCASVDRYSHGLSENDIPGDVLRKAGNEFDDINRQLKLLLVKRHITFKLPKHVENVHECNEKLRALEHHIDICGLFNHGTVSLREQLEKLVAATRELLEAQGDSSISRVLNKIDRTMDENNDDAEVVPKQARKLLNVLSKSGIPEAKKRELVEMARKLWKGWEINRLDIKFIRKSNGDRKLIGSGSTGQVYLARMKSRDENHNIIRGELNIVAVKQFTVKASEEKQEYAKFIREIFLQKEAKHPCIVKTLGGHWPDAEEIGDEDLIEPFIVMERMTHNLRQMQAKGLLSTLESKRSILRDILAGLAHLHSRRIIHRDIKPENVLVRVVHGRIVGRAKVSDFSVSRKAERAEMMTKTKRTSTGAVGTLAYMPPEAFSKSAQKANMSARDIWSFGVLMCEVIEPDFLGSLVRDQPKRLHSVSERTQFAKKVAEMAHSISYDWVLEHIVSSCLFLDPELRPRIEELAVRLENDAPGYQFSFEEFYSWEYRSNNVLRYVRKYCNSSTSDIETAADVLKERSRNDSDFSAQSVLGYCYYYGIGVKKREKKAIDLFQNGCIAGDSMAFYAMGVLNFRADKIDKAVTLLSKAANLGNTGATLWLAVCYQFGYGVEKNAKKTFKLISSAAKSGNEDAEGCLPLFFVNGIGTTKNERKAFELLHRSSARGNALASCMLALWYKEGILVTKDRDNSKQLLVLARKQGIDGEWALNQERNCWEISEK